MIKVRVQGPARGKIVGEALTSRGLTWTLSVLQGRSSWHEFTLDTKQALDTREMKEWLKRERGGDAVGIETDQPVTRAFFLPDWQQRELNRNREYRERKRKEREERTRRLRAEGKIEFSILDKLNRGVIEHVLNQLPDPYESRPGGAYWVYTVKCPLSEDAFQDWLNRTFPQVVCKVVRV